MDEQGGPNEDLTRGQMRRSWESVLAATILGLVFTVACFVIAGVTDRSTPIGFAVLGCFFRDSSRSSRGEPEAGGSEHLRAKL